MVSGNFAAPASLNQSVRYANVAVDVPMGTAFQRPPTNA